MVFQRKESTEAYSERCSLRDDGGAEGRNGDHRFCSWTGGCFTECS